MPKCKNCIPAGEVNIVACSAFDPREKEVEGLKLGNPITCDKNTFPGYDFCPEHLLGRGLNLTKMTADYIADKEGD